MKNKASETTDAAVPAFFSAAHGVRPKISNEDHNEEDMSAEEEDEDESEQASESEPESESATEVEEKEPCALVDGLMNIVFHEYAGSGRVGIEHCEIVSMLKSKVNNPVTKHDTLVNNMRFNININQAIRGACHAPIYAL